MTVQLQWYYLRILGKTESVFHLKLIFRNHLSKSLSLTGHLVNFHFCASAGAVLRGTADTQLEWKGGHPLMLYLYITQINSTRILINTSAHINTFLNPPAPMNIFLLTPPSLQAFILLWSMSAQSSFWAQEYWYLIIIGSLYVTQGKKTTDNPTKHLFPVLGISLLLQRMNTVNEIFI